MIPPIYATLSADSGVTAIIGAGSVCRCYPFGVAPVGTTVPYVTWSTVSGTPENKLTQGAFYDRFRVQVDAWAATGASANTLAEAVRSALEPVGVAVSINLNERDPETKLYRFSMDFELIENR